MSSWRDSARPIIRRVIAEVGTDDMKRTRAALRQAYPFGEREMWPYKVWCDEVRRQLGIKAPLSRKSRERLAAYQRIAPTLWHEADTEPASK